VPIDRPRKGKPQRLGALIPEAARALGFEAALELAQQAAVLHAVLQEIAPHLAPHCRLTGSEKGRLVLEADDRATAQELHLRGAEIAGVYAQRPDGRRAVGLLVRLSTPTEDTERH